MAGGGQGSRSRSVPRLGSETELETQCSGRYEMHAGERFLLQNAGGGGFDDPRRRNPQALERDIAEGYVSVEGTSTDYHLEMSKTV